MLKKKTLYWLLSFVITLAFAVFQRVTGPTYPVKGRISLDGGNIVSFRLPRNCTIAGQDCLIKIVSPEQITGFVSWRRYPAREPWTETRMSYRDGLLSAMLPDQPPAGKLEYRVFINGEKGGLGETATRSSLGSIPRKGGLELYGKPVVTRFKGAVPAAILVPHVLFMFLFMLFSVRIFITVFTMDTVIKHAVALNILFLILGGFVLGPLTQFHAFGSYWTGWPFGHDLTDTKTLVMLAFWLAALCAIFRIRRPKPWLLAAFAVTALVYLVPHSMLGSELDYSNIDAAQSGKGTK